MLKISSIIDKSTSQKTDLVFFILLTLSFLLPNYFSLIQTHIWLLVIWLLRAFSIFDNNKKIDIASGAIFFLGILLFIQSLIYTPNLVGRHYRFITLIGYPLFFVFTHYFFK